MSDSEACIICLDNPRNTMFLPCAHKVLCKECRDEMKHRNNKTCPLCRDTILNFIDID